MKNVKFILKCILAALPIIGIVTFTLVCPFCYMDEEYPAWRYTMDVCEGKITDDFDTVIVGDSRAMAALIPKELEDAVGKTVNLAVGGATSIESYYFIKQYLENNDAPKNIIIMIAPFHYSYIDNFDTRTVYFRSLKLSDSTEIYKNANNLDTIKEDNSEDKSSVIEGNYIINELSARLGLPTKYLPALMNSRFIGRRAENEALYSAYRDSCGQGFFGTEDYCDAPNYEVNYTEMKKDADARLLDMYYEKLLGICSENAERVIVLQAPMNTASVSKLNKGYTDEYLNYVEEKCSGYSNLEYEREITEYANEYFGDASHLNEKGAKKYSKEVAGRYFD